MTVQGNLLELAKQGRYDAIAQSCNCFCNMGRGIAPQIAREFPEAKDADDATERGDKSKLGHFSVGQSSQYNVLIYNIYGQYGWKSEQVTYGTDYKSIFMGLRRMRDDLVSRFFTAEEVTTIKVGFPKIGCGFGGGDWEFISGMIDEVFKDIPLVADFEVEYVEYQG